MLFGTIKIQNKQKMRKCSRVLNFRIKRCKVSHSVVEHQKVRVLKIVESVFHCFRVWQSVAKCCRAFNGSIERCKASQSVTEC